MIAPLFVHGLPWQHLCAYPRVGSRYELCWKEEPRAWTCTEVRDGLVIGYWDNDPEAWDEMTLARFAHCDPAELNPLDKIRPRGW